MIEFGCVSSRILWVKFMFSRVEVCVVEERYDLREGNGEERERFLNDLDRIMDSTGNGYRLCALGDLNE